MEWTERMLLFNLNETRNGSEPQEDTWRQATFNSETVVP